MIKMNRKIIHLVFLFLIFSSIFSLSALSNKISTESKIKKISGWAYYDNTNNPANGANAVIYLSNYWDDENIVDSNGRFVIFHELAYETEVELKFNGCCIYNDHKEKIKVTIEGEITELKVPVILTEKDDVFIHNIMHKLIHIIPFLSFFI